MKPLYPTQVARLLGIDRKTLRGWREHGGGPPYLDMTAPDRATQRDLIRYPAEEFEKWYKARFFQSPQQLIDDAQEEVRKEGPDA